MATVSYAVQPGGCKQFVDSFAHVIATRPSYDIYVGGCVAHLTWEGYTETTFAGRAGCWTRKTVLPPPGSLLVMRARDTKEFYVGTVTGPAVEQIVPCAVGTWDWAFRKPVHRRESQENWARAIAVGLPAEDYIISIPVVWNKVSSPTVEQRDSYKGYRPTICRMSRPWPATVPSSTPILVVEEDPTPSPIPATAGISLHLLAF
ncbi:hypothetical protein EBX31_11350 [bacterium]|nr:hypothetical protein [bacterium]